MTVQSILLARLVRKGLATRGACVWRLRNHLDGLLEQPEDASVETARTELDNDDATWLLGDHMVGRYQRRIERVSR